MKTYYNEFDKKKCAALSRLMKDGFITKGEIDDRSIKDIKPEDVRGYDRCHFFAGIGLWDYALQLAGWPADRPVWTGSCPCQPFSYAGRKKGKADDRHLWPEWLRLIEECSPAKIFGEQVSNAIAYGWLDDVYQGLEAHGYAVGSVVLPACSVGAPHRRNRLWFVGDSEYDGSPSNTVGGSSETPIQHDTQGQNSASQFEGTGEPGSVSGGTMGNADKARPQGRDRGELQECSGERTPWSSGIWIDCPDGKQRLIEPGIPLLAHGYPERVGVIHCAGDAIVAQVAAEFIAATMY